MHLKKYRTASIAIITVLCLAVGTSFTALPAAASVVIGPPVTKAGEEAAQEYARKRQEAGLDSRSTAESDTGTDAAGETERALGASAAAGGEDTAEAGQAAASSGLQAAAIDMPDGEYSIDVGMTGGSGRANVSSPTYMTIKDGHAYARLIWSSSHYDYMIMEGKKYLNETKDGGPSTFTIPIPWFDDTIDIIGDTTAMGDPLEISYRITFYRDSIGSTGMIPQEAAKRVLITAVLIIAAGGILNFFVKRRRR